MHTKTLSQRGSVLLVVLIVTTAIAMIAGALLTYTNTERRLNGRTHLRYEAKNAAEALLEYAAAELRVRFSSNKNFSTTALSTLPIEAHTDRFGTLYEVGEETPTHVQPETGDLWVSQTSEMAQRYIDPTNPENDYDPLRGQRIRSQAVRLLARVNAENAIGVTTTSWATQLFEVREAALFNYAIFYNLNMEFHPSPSMTVVGPVHSNASSNLTEGAGLKFLGTFSTAGNFTAGATTSGRPSGRNIAFTTGVDDNGDGTIDTIGINNPSLDGQSLGTYVDSTLSQRLNNSPLNFTNVSSQLWRGFVQDSSHGVMPQNPPGVLTPAQARQLVLPPNPGGEAAIEEQKFSTQAGLYFLVEPSGNVLAFHDASDAVTYKSLNAGNRATWRTNPLNANKIVIPPANMIRSNRRMRDHREAAWVNTIDVDVGRMRQAVLAATPNSANNFKVNGADWAIDNNTNGWNGIVYFDVENPNASRGTVNTDVPSAPSGSTSRMAVRLLNGSRLPSRGADAGMTVATNAPVYIVGNYNADGTLQGDLSDMTEPEGNEVPAAVAADAINVLSNAWWNGTYPTGDVTSNDSTAPNASHTEVSCAFLSGIVQTSGNNYSGGVENYPRFHENWTNRSLRYRGSIVALFTSAYATGRWGSARYSAPRREWGFNSMFANGNYPPGTPRLRTYRRLDYRDLTQAEFDTLLADSRLAFMEM